MTIFRESVLPPAMAVLISGGLLVFGMGADDQQAYLFSNLFVAVMLILALVWLAQEVVTSQPSVLQAVPWASVLSGLLIVVIYLALAPVLGFASSSFLLILVIGVAYSPDGQGARNVLMSLLVAAIVVAVIYGLFNVFLKVQTPGGFI